MKTSLAFVLLFVTQAMAAAPLAPSAPTYLTCEWRQAPLNVDLPHPRLGWILSSSQRGDAQTAWQVLVASTPTLLSTDHGDLWDSGKTTSDQTIQIPYAGKPLVSNQPCYWKVRFWNAAGVASPWSEPANWSMGLLSPEDWKAKWVEVPGGAAGEAQQADYSNTLGYHAAISDTANTLRWVQVDLGKSYPIDSVKLHSLDHEVKGFGFPVRFTITASDDPDFATSSTIADETARNFPNPGDTAVAFTSHRGISGRYVRITATRLFQRTLGDRDFCFALAELQVFSDGKNVALHAPVSAQDSVENWGWGKQMLTDGLNLAPDAAGNAIATDTTRQISTLPLFRKSFHIDQPIARAIIHISGLGQFELHLNGKKVGDTVLDPGWTDYRKTCLYCSYDVTDQLKVGDNVLGVLLGNGMYNVQKAEGRYTKFTGSMGPTKLIAQLEITHPDGSTETVCSDQSWQVAGGPITFTSIYGGEDFDARGELPGWDSAAADLTGWQPASECDGPGGALFGVSRSALPITVAQVMKTKRILHPGPGVWVYDFGQNCAMMPLITVHGAAGAVVRLVPGEVINSDETVSQESSGGPVWFSYTLKGQGAETWSPKFSYYGYRYLQVSGAVPANSPNPQSEPVIENLEGQFITSTAPVAGSFSCSDVLFNKTANLIRWAMRNNMMSVLTDCPHRERLGWLEESHLVGPSLMDNFEIPALFNKISADTRDSQTERGLVPDIAPEYAVFGGGFRDSPEWGSASILVPWQLHDWYGDSEILATQYPTMKRYVDYLTSRAHDNIAARGLGDWYDLGPKPPGESQLTPADLTATAFYYRDITLLAKAAKILANEDDATHYTQLAQQVRDAFNQRFYDPNSHEYATGSQTANAIPLVFDLAPESDRAAILDNVVADIRNRNNRLTAGDVGYRYLLRALADGGRSDVIYDMNSRSDRPGYGMIIDRGATSLTEAWDARPESSQDHFMLGHIMEWFYSDLAGIQQEPDSVAFKKIVIKPTPVGNITWTKASYESASGQIQSNWQIRDGAFTLDVVIPMNTTATIHLPKRFSGSITESGKPLKEAVDVSAESARDGTNQDVAIHVLSGSYHFVGRPAL